MSAGKIAAQSFQAAQRLFASARDDAELTVLLERWQTAGTRTCTRIALSQAVFDRACRELPGAIMVDEGMNEVDPYTATCLATAPLPDGSELPRILRHKRMPVLNAEVHHVSDTSRRSSAVEHPALNPVVRGFDSHRLLVPAREAELAQHRQADLSANAEVAGSNPAASSWPSGRLSPSAFTG